MNKIKYQQGQVLLITMMLLATALTVVLAITFKSTTETQTTKLQEDSQKALAAAEAGIEKALKTGNNVNLGEADFGIGTGLNASVTASSISSPDFTTPSLNKDEQYTLYLGTPQNDVDFTNLTPVYSGNLFVCFKSVALELTLINNDETITRYAVNPQSGTPIINSADTASSPDTNCPSGDFDSKYQISANANSILLITRVITSGSTSTKIGFKGGASLPVQGKTLVSTGTTQTGVTKKVQLFQSYPQIPSGFFVTSF